MENKSARRKYFFFQYLVNCINEDVINCEFPDHLKLTNMLSAYKKKDPANKENYRPLSILTLLSKVYVKVMKGNFTNTWMSF